MGGERRHAGTGPRWAARLALLVAAGALVLVLTAAGIDSLGLLVVGLAGLAVTAAALWWTLSRRGLVRALAAVLALLTPGAVLLAYSAVGLLWAVL